MRYDWEFCYENHEVREAVEKVLQHHRDRRAWWEGELNKAEEDLKQKGFEYRERMGSGRSNIEIVGDPEIAKRVSVCKSSMRRHEERVEEFECWARALKKASDSLRLTYDDVRYFQLK
jgi:hypothetical protein